LIAAGHPLAKLAIEQVIEILSRLVVWGKAALHHRLAGEFLALHDMVLAYDWRGGVEAKVLDRDILEGLVVVHLANEVVAVEEVTHVRKAHCRILRDVGGMLVLEVLVKEVLRFEDLATHSTPPLVAPHFFLGELLQSKDVVVSCKGTV